MRVWETRLAHLVVYSLVHFGFVVQDDEGLGGRRVAVEDEAEVAALALHVSEVDQGGVESKWRTGACNKSAVLVLGSKNERRGLDSNSLPGRSLSFYLMLIPCL